MVIFVWSVSAYRPRPYPNRVIYFWAKEETDSRRKAWDKVAHAEGAEICMIPGNHDSCRQEHVHELAEHIGMYLRKAQAAIMGSNNEHS